MFKQVMLTKKSKKKNKPAAFKDRWLILPMEKEKSVENNRKTKTKKPPHLLGNLPPS